jgi:hypothetical protein
MAESIATSATLGVSGLSVVTGYEDQFVSVLVTSAGATSLQIESGATIALPTSGQVWPVALP